MWHQPRWRPRELGDVLAAVLGQQGVWDCKDADILLSAIQLLKDGFSRHEPYISGSFAECGLLNCLLLAASQGPFCSLPTSHLCCQMTWVHCT